MWQIPLLPAPQNRNPIENFFLSFHLSKFPFFKISKYVCITPFDNDLGSLPLLGEKVDPCRWIAVVVGFIGMLIVKISCLLNQRQRFVANSANDLRERMLGPAENT